MQVMPTTVHDLFEAARVARPSVVRWGTTIPGPKPNQPDTGIYVVALTEEPDTTDGAVAVCPISRDAMRRLLDTRPELTLDGRRPDVESLARRIAAFWYPDEVVVYIGLAGPRQRVKVSALSDRVREYYSTPLGARSPHAGGWPIKTLGILNQLYVHFGYCDDVANREHLMLAAFATGVSESSRSLLHDRVHLMPFANLTSGTGRKAHGILGARAPRGARTSPTVPRSPVVSTTKVAPASSVHTQRITEGDIRRGIIRIPRATKALFPSEPMRVDVNLRGELKSCRWDPRFGPDQERSGVLGLGVKSMRTLVLEGERLSVRRVGSTVHLE
jgi:hypothetical protein